MPPERHLAFDCIHNIRDLGGYARANGEPTAWRSVLRACGMRYLSRADMDGLVTAGLATVIDLRSAVELERHPDPFADDPRVDYINIPLFAELAPVGAAERKNGAPFDIAARYRAALDTCQEPIARVLRVMASAPPGAILFHCTAGKDRTGIIAALLLGLAEVADETIVEDYAMTATVAAPLIARLREEALARGGTAELVDAILTSDPETMRTTLAHLDAAYGGAGAYARRIGLDAATCARLVARLC